MSPQALTIASPSLNHSPLKEQTHFTYQYSPTGCNLRPPSYPPRPQQSQPAPPVVIMKFQTAALVVAFCGSVLAAPSARCHNERGLIPGWPPFEDSDFFEASAPVQPVARAAFEEGREISLVPNLLDLMRKALFELLKKRLGEFEGTDAGSTASDDSDPKNLGSKLAALGPLEVDLPGVDAIVIFDQAAN